MGDMLDNPKEMPHLGVFLVLISASIATQSQEHTPSWVNICGGTYPFSEHMESWDDANGECELYGSHLLQIDNLAENFCLLDYAHTVGISDNFWHSANDIGSEGVWRQYDGKLIDWSPWWRVMPNDPNGGDPNLGEHENCGAFTLSKSRDAGKWFDYPCTEADHYRYICE